MAKPTKRILNVTVKKMYDDSPDTSWLGEYSNKPKSEYAIDRMHAEDCASVRADIREAKQTLEHVQQTIGDSHNAVLAQYNGTLANDELDSERDALGDAYDEVGELFDTIDECDCGERGDMRRGELRYFNGPVENYKGETPENIRKYVRQDYKRMEGLNNGDWCFLGVRAEAKVLLIENANVLGQNYTFKGSLFQTITSGGLWGNESDMPKDDWRKLCEEQLAELKDQLLALGFSRRAIATAFKQIQYKEGV